MSGTKNLIMGVWTRHALLPLEKFIGSLRRTSFDGDVCVFVDDVPSETVASLRSHGIIVERAGTSAQPLMAVQASRFFTFLDFLTRHVGDYANVMVADLREIVFQGDPFGRPLPADIVFVRERCLLAEAVESRFAVVQAYGEAVAHNLRNCTVACAGVTLGTTAGMLRYLVAMTREMAGRTPVINGTEQGIHNYVARMYPLRNAWFDPTDSIVATMVGIQDASIQISDQGVLIDGHVVPVLHQWDRNRIVRDYVAAAPQFQLAEPAVPRTQPAAEPQLPTIPAADEVALTRKDAVVVFYHPRRDSGWLQQFLQSLDSVGYAGEVHCVGEFAQPELELLARHGCIVYRMAATDPAAADNIAHFFLSQVLDRLAADRAPHLDQVLMIDTARAVFLRDPFLGKTIGLSAFCESAMRIGESEYNQRRLAFFVPADEHWDRLPVVSSAMLRGKLEVVREFYRKLFAELVGRAELFGVQKVVQGAVNKLCHGGGLPFPVTLYPSAAEAYFDFWPAELPVDTRHGVRIGGAVPAVVLSGSLETDLMRKLRVSLYLPGA